MDEDRTMSALKRVAQALNVSEELFLEGGSEQGGAAVQAWTQELELLKLFSEITDPEERRSCLQYLRAFAQLTDMAAK